MNRIVREDIDTIIASGGSMWEKFANKRVLVTGANGLIGYYFVSTLMALGNCKVIALVRNGPKAIKRFSDFLENKNFALLVQDVCKPIDIIGPIDYIIHAASQASSEYITKDPIGTMLPNVIGTNNLLLLAKEKKSKGFLFVSGGEVYGKGQEGVYPTTEDDYGYLDTLNPRSCYGEGKRAGETLCACYKAQYNVPFVIARLAHTYGPGITREDGRVFSSFAYDIVDNQNIHLNSDGSAIRSFCYITDAITGMFIALLKGKVGEAYNICNEMECTSIFNLATMLADIYHTGVKVCSDRKDPFSRSCLDSFKLRELGWTPQVEIKDGFTRTIESIKDGI